MVLRWTFKHAGLLFLYSDPSTQSKYVPIPFLKISLYNIFLDCLFRVNIYSEESLFGVNRLQDIQNFQLQKYCDCATEIRSSEDSMANHFTANCSFATPAILCSQQTTTQRYTSTCKRYQDRFKCDANLEDDDSDDVMEVSPLKLDPNFDLNFIPPVIFLKFYSVWF